MAHVKKVYNRNRRRGILPRPQPCSFTVIALRFYMSLLNMRVGLMIVEGISLLLLADEIIC